MRPAQIDNTEHLYVGVITNNYPFETSSFEVLPDLKDIQLGLLTELRIKHYTRILLCSYASNFYGLFLINFCPCSDDNDVTTSLFSKDYHAITNAHYQLYFNYLYN